MDPEELELRALAAPVQELPTLPPPAEDPAPAKIEEPPRGFTLTTWGTIILGVVAVVVIVAATLIFWPKQEDPLDAQLRELEDRVEAYLKQHSKGGR